MQQQHLLDQQARNSCSCCSDNQDDDDGHCSISSITAETYHDRGSKPRHCFQLQHHHEQQHDRRRRHKQPRQQRQQRQHCDIGRRSHSFLMSTALMLLVLSLYGSTTRGEDSPVLAPVLQVGSFFVVDIEECYSDLLLADSDEDGGITEDEYVRLVTEQTDGLVNVTSYDELPTEFKITFTQTACFCQNPTYGGDAADVDCCKDDAARIVIPEDPDQNPTEADEAYLNGACSLVQGAAAQTTAHPTISPTNAPTFTPTTSTPTTSTPTTVSPTTALPSGTPSDLPTTVTPTTFPPTVAPTTPTEPPTTPPTTPSPTTTTASPTVPTDPPTYKPTTTSPTESPIETAPPTSVPTQVPPTQREANVQYRIAVLLGNTLEERNEYLFDLSTAVDNLADVVAGEVETPAADGRRRLAVAPGHRQDSLLRRRRLQLTTGRGSGFGEITDIDCPPDFTDEDFCQQVTSEIGLLIIDEPESDDVVVSNFEAAMVEAIKADRLKGFLADTGIVVLLDVSVSPTSTDPLTSGAIAGIVMGALVVVLCTVTLVLVERGVTDESKPDYEGFEPEAPEQEDPSILPAQSEDMSLYTDAAVGTTATATSTGPSILGATQPDYGDKVEPVTVKDLEAMEAGEDIVAEPGTTEPDGSSNAGSSGWSSSAGVSSLNTGSMDESIDAAASYGANLASFGAASNMVSSLDRKGPKSSDDTEGVPGVPAVSRDQLDSLIEAGDWAAVGATAALLAAASDSQSASSRSRGTTRSRDSGSIDAARAAELDHLVDAGDWEGVVLAAAKFQASSESAGDTRTGDSLDSIDSLTGTGTGTGTAGSPSASTSLSETPSKAQKAAETRAEVEALVRRVVPDEIDNVDEMMNQFKGREEELVETLRTMQERAVAQKARTSSQKEAKYKARQTAKQGRGVVPGAGNVAQRLAQVESTEESDEDGKPPAAPAPTQAANTSVDTSAVAPPPSTTSVSSPATKSSSVKDVPRSPSLSASVSASDRSETTAGSKVRSALELAIEAGDWEAVGEAAAMMSDVSVHSVSTGEVDRLADASISRTSTASRSASSRSRKSLEGVNAARAAQLDSLIDQGDWDAVVSAANRFNETDKKTEPARMSQEEEDALKQAELWMKIADQKKAEGATDVGASDAAEWAIQRSLLQMKEAEKKKPPRKSDSYEEDEV